MIVHFIFISKSTYNHFLSSPSLLFLRLSLFFDGAPNLLIGDLGIGFLNYKYSTWGQQLQLVFGQRVEQQLGWV